jgi:hypothetical protein
MDYLGELKAKIKLLHGCEATHRQTVPVKKAFPGKMVWDGEVEVFDVTGDAKTKHCYAWGYANERHPDRLDVVAVLEIPPVISPETAVKAATTVYSNETINE